MKTGIDLIADERRTHVEKGWSTQHDDRHIGQELENSAVQLIEDGWTNSQDIWGLVLKTKQEGGRVRQLVVAGSLIAAEIDRILRIEQRTKK